MGFMCVKAQVSAVRFSAVFTDDKSILRKKCEHLLCYNVNIAPYRLIYDLLPDTGSEPRSQKNYERVTP